MPRLAEKQSISRSAEELRWTQRGHRQKTEEDESQSVCVCMFGRQSWREREWRASRRKWSSATSTSITFLLNHLQLCVLTQMHTHTQRLLKASAAYCMSCLLFLNFFFFIPLPDLHTKTDCRSNRISLSVHDNCQKEKKYCFVSYEESKNHAKSHQIKLITNTKN